MTSLRLKIAQHHLHLGASFVDCGVVLLSKPSSQLHLHHPTPPSHVPCQNNASSFCKLRSNLGKEPQNTLPVNLWIDMCIHRSKLYDVVVLPLDLKTNSNGEVNNVKQIECHAPYHQRCKNGYLWWAFGPHH